MKIADDFDAIRQRAREIAEANRPTPAASVDPAWRELSAAPQPDYEADVSAHYFPIGMIVA